MKPFVKINSAEYSTDLNIFVENQVHVIQHLDRTTSIYSRLEKRCFKKRLPISPFDEKEIMSIISLIHSEILSLKYGGVFTS